MPRKKLEWTEDQIEIFQNLCGIFCDEDEICFVMGHTKAELEKLINKHLREDVTGKRNQKITFEDAFNKYSAEGKISLRRTQLELALAGDKAMLVWLGKQYLGQTDPDKGKARATRADAPPRVLEVQHNIQSFRQRSPVAKAAGM